MFDHAQFLKLITVLNKFPKYKFPRLNKSSKCSSICIQSIVTIIGVQYYLKENFSHTNRNKGDWIRKGDKIGGRAGDTTSEARVQQSGSHWRGERAVCIRTSILNRERAGWDSLIGERGFVISIPGASD